MQVVASDFPFDGFDVLRRADAFGAIVEFDDEVEGSTDRREELEGAVRIEHGAGGLHTDGILASKVSHLDTQTVSGDERLHEKVGETFRVVVMANRDFLKVAPLRQDCVGAVQHAVAIAGQLPVARRAAATGRGVQPRGQPVLLLKLLQPLAHAAFGGEGQAE